ncbi:hypothetical protein [Ohtaekwangia koreensis]|uniref:Uncharacterized protein n=1 Tax=Ohtaekwangia koreensis TaxID=688867 RepID=A0A1T5JQT0_9BACT|nr:hypothetical protein [Ohtaekwangia koreensis]SKC53762.1 hypothetical protein SAMN05660236_1380 [Ohtaekwangia koreensis]
MRANTNYGDTIDKCLIKTVGDCIYIYIYIYIVFPSVHTGRFSTGIENIKQTNERMMLDVSDKMYFHPTINLNVETSRTGNF